MIYIPWAAPDLSTELLETKVSINHGRISSSILSPAHLTIAPNALAVQLLTSGTGSNKDCFKPGIIADKYGFKSF